MRGETQFAKVGDVYLAYQAFGTGERTIVLVNGWPSHVEGMWDVPEIAALLERMSQFAHVILFDNRGTGLSDRTTDPLTVEVAADDIVAVMGAAGVEQAVMLGMMAGASAALVAAVRYPERCEPSSP